MGTVRERDAHPAAGAEGRGDGEMAEAEEGLGVDGSLETWSDG